MNPKHTSPPFSLRLILPAMLVVTAFVTLLPMFNKPSLNSVLCGAGFCRDDQANSGLSYIGMDPANPYKWASYAEFLDAQGRTGAAAAAFERALILGPAIAPVHMRAFNFHLIHEHSDRVLDLGHRILTLTSAYNQIIFTDFLGIPITEIIRRGIPSASAAAYLDWAQARRPTTELLEIWKWMVQKDLDDAASAASLCTALCGRREYETAARLWAQWLGPNRDGYLGNNFLNNSHFSHKPLNVPMDWTIDPASGVETDWKNGLSVVFAGAENLTYRHVRQLAYVAPGTYVFSAVVEGRGITTNEGPYFHLYDPDHPGKLDLVTDQIRGTVPRGTIQARFTVGSATRAIITQLERRASERLDNRIAGTLKIYELSLRRVD